MDGGRGMPCLSLPYSNNFSKIFLSFIYTGYIKVRLSFLIKTIQVHKGGILIRVLSTKKLLFIVQRTFGLLLKKKKNGQVIPARWVGRR